MPVVAMANHTSAISACIVCRNEADRLQPCLESVTWADEIVVMDLSSSDGSAELAESLGARVIRHEPVEIVELVRNELAEAARDDWILVLDPDERVTPGLAAALRSAADREDIDAVVLPRMNFDLGYPPSNPLHRYEPQLRMYRRSAVRWPRIPNALPEVPEERLLRLPQEDDLVLIHDRSRSIPEVLERMVRYSEAQAQSMIDRGEVFRAGAMLWNLSRHARKQFIWGDALRDGMPGLLRGGILVAFHFFVWAAFWQLSGAERKPEDERLLGRIRSILRIGQAGSRLVSLPVRLLRSSGKSCSKYGGAASRTTKSGKT
jgi:glycosyltransferase involved in cell wall biosynthesis